MKRFTPNKPVEQWLLIPGLIGFVYYALLTRFHGLNPFDVDWMLPFWRGSIDSAQHYLGWEFFRQAPLLQWPPGKSPNLGPMGGSGVALTDSLPLFAFIFKPLTFWFTQPFQYFGIWVLTCFVLQAIFAWKLLTIWVKHWEHAVLGTYFFCFAPIFIDRMTVHLALAGHWLLLAGLYLLFSPKSKFKHWIVLAAVSMLVQPYLAIICAAMFFAWLLIALLNTRAVFQFVKQLLIFIGVLFASGWSSGLFIFGLGSAQAAGFGTYSANVLAWVDPGFTWYEKALWSRYVPDQWQNAGQYEGMNYLGSGVLLLAIVALGYQLIKGTWKSRGIQTAIVLSFVAVFGRSGTPQTELVLLLGALSAVMYSALSKQLSLNKSTTVIYAFLFTSLMLIAFTYQIFIGDFLIANFTIPVSVNNLLSVVRTSGRMLWPITYLLIGALIVLVGQNFRKLIATGLMVLVLCIQVFESAEATAVTGSLFSRKGPEEFLRSPLWDKIAQKYRNVVIVLPSEGPILYPTNPDFVAPEGSFLWREIGMFAVQNQMSLNSFYFSREPASQNKTDTRTISEAVSQAKYRVDSLYIFIDSAMWDLAKKANVKTDLMGVLDGVPIVAPGLESCTACDLTGFERRD
jgi:hypothetical protein